MGETDIGSSVSSNLANAMTDYSVNAETTQAGDEEEFTFPDAAKYLGYYLNIPELNSVIDARATWTIGKGYKADPEVKLILNSLKGYGKDTFNTILENMIRGMFIDGDAFSEIIRDENKTLINLKPLDTASMKIVTDKKGMILRYEQMNKTKKDTTFKTKEIFHLARNRVLDSIKGTSVITKLENIILMRNEAMADYKTVMHRFISPRWIFHLDTDDPNTIAGFKATQDKANADGENMYIPKDAVVPELMATAPNATLNPQAWIEQLNDYFYEACNVPKIIVGGSKGFTEAAVKIVYLAFQQSVEEDQLYIEEQVGLQLGQKIELEFPASLENELLSDKKKDVESGAAKPSETTAGVGQW